MSESNDDRIGQLADDLFAAGRDEEPSKEGRERAMAALGLVGEPPTPGGGGSGSGTGSGGLGVKIATAGGVAAVVGLSVWLVSRVLATTAPVQAEAEAPPAATSAVLVLPIPPSATVSAWAVPPPDVPSATASVEPIASAPAFVRSAKPGASASPGTAALADDLAAELADLDKARQKIRAGDSAGALAQLDTYAKNHPKGTLATEATLLRVEALVGAGRRDEARTVAAPLLERRDMAGDRARKLLER